MKTESSPASLAVALLTHMESVAMKVLKEKETTEQEREKERGMNTHGEAPPLKNHAWSWFTRSQSPRKEKGKTDSSDASPAEPPGVAYVRPQRPRSTIAVSPTQRLITNKRGEQSK